MIFGEPIPFEEAIQIAQDKGLLASTLSSAELRRLKASLKRRAIFSAKVDQISRLERLGKLFVAIAGGTTDEHGRLTSIPEAKAQLGEQLRAQGYLPEEGQAGTLQDFSSDARRQLQVETNVLDLLGHARWKATQNEEELQVNPAWELVRMVDSKVPRNWIMRWKAARAATTAEGSTDPDETGRMVALKNHPIWQALGDGAGGYTDTLGNPWAPFAFNSGMNTIDVPRDEAVALGLLNPDTRIDPQDEPMNENLEASVGGFDEHLRQALEDDPQLEVKDGVLRLKAENSGSLLNRLRGLVLVCNVRAFLRDRLGRFSSTGTLSSRDNIRRGKKAAREALAKKRDVPHAMNVKGLGSIDFDWGRPGTRKANVQGATHSDGYGISHIQAKRGDRAVLMLPFVLAKGKIAPNPRAEGRKLVQWKGWTASVEKKSGGRSYVVTSIDKELIGSNAQEKGQLPFRSTGPGTKTGIGSVLPRPTHEALLLAKGPVVASNTLNIDQGRARLQALARLLKSRRAA